MATKENSKKTSIGKRIAYIVMLIIAVAYYPVVMSFVSSEKALTECTKVVTSVANSSADVMITEKNLERIIDQNWPAIKGTLLNEMNLNEMESRIEQLPMVKRCEMYFTAGGVLHVEVLQREPLMHVFSSDGSYYIDAEMNKFSSERGMMANTIVVNGYVNSAVDTSELVELCQFIHDDSFWRAQIEQIYVTEKQEFMLVPRVGEHIIEIGTIERLDEKMTNLRLLYTKGWAPREWNLYKRINLKYKDQVVCTKK